VFNNRRCETSSFAAIFFRLWRYASDVHFEIFPNSFEVSLVQAVGVKVDRRGNNNVQWRKRRILHDSVKTDS
jgi:hypothetical protein